MKASVKTIALSMTGVLGFAQIAMAMPTPDRNGNFQPSQNPRAAGHRNWIVVESDPRGLNCRMLKDYQRFSMDGADTPPEVYRNKFHRISRWDVVFTFSKGQRLQAVTGNVGGNQIMLTDERGLPWLPVEVQKNGRGMNCFVRANSRFIKPI